jgi:hypothetical protein
MQWFSEKEFNKVRKLIDSGKNAKAINIGIGKILKITPPHLL